MITQEQLNGYFGKHIKEICQNHFVSDDDNHCAHFVSHAMGYHFGVTCRTMGHGQQPGANIRVQEVFPRCPSVGEWDSRPGELTTCLAFITRASNVNVAARTMANVPRKHIGIFFGGLIWHYSNSKHKVVNQTPQQFSTHYPSPYNAMFYGSLP